MITFLNRSLYDKYAKLYSTGLRYNPGSSEYNQIVNVERISPNEAAQLRIANNVYTNSLTYIDSLPKLTPRIDQLFNVSTQPTTVNIGLPPGRGQNETTPTGTETTRTGTETTPGTTENFISKYKMPLIIGAVAIGYFFLRKK